MKSRNRKCWLAYALVASALIAVHVGLSRAVQKLERSERAAHRATWEQAALRRAQRQLDTWLSPLIARESARSPAEYSAYLSQNGVTPGLSNVRVDVLTPSPLLTERSRYFRLHFELRPRTSLGTYEMTSCSPQVPSVDALVEHSMANNLMLPTEFESNNDRLTEANQFLLANSTIERFNQSESLFREILGPTGDPVSRSTPAINTRNPGNPYNRRARNYANAIQSQSFESQKSNWVDPPPAVDSTLSERVGPLVPFWTSSEAVAKSEGPELLLLRKLDSPLGQRYQGVWIHWAELEQALHQQLAELELEAELVPIFDPSESAIDTDKMLATLPVAVHVTTPSIGAVTSHPRRNLLGLTWTALILALVACAFGLRSMLAFGERRSRFASAVTHELRTPLTTFQLYSELLADNMVQDPARRQEYLETLRGESKRLSNLVENVLAYARLEEGPTPDRRESITISGLLRGVQPELERIVNDAGMRLEFQPPNNPDSLLRTDRESVTQILINLVDNAGKYAASGEQLDLCVSANGNEIRIQVRDYGAGIPPEAAKRIFSPFERGGRESGSIPGVGLGLSLARQCARNIGGQLSYRDADPGAEFTLVLPR